MCECDCVTLGGHAHGTPQSQPRKGPIGRRRPSRDREAVIRLSAPRRSLISDSLSFRSAPSPSPVDVGSLPVLIAVSLHMQQTSGFTNFLDLDAIFKIQNNFK